jgi:uncharacterized membrane protein YeaQ/YmgE (transglycosylase-associated protein family)
MGLTAGLLVGRLSHHTAGALALDVTLGILGGIGGGLAVNALGFPQPTGFIVASLFGAGVGAVAVLASYRAIFRPV